MQQHPVPQHIAGYEFRLVGDMTLKQFLELAAGVAIAGIIYGTGLPVFFKYPLMLIAGASGAAFAFLPFEERPLDVWVKNFIKSVYSPTLYLWQKKESLPDFFLYHQPVEKKSASKMLSPAERAQYAEYLKTIPKNQKTTPFDTSEQASLEKINQLLQPTTAFNPVKTANPIPSYNPGSLPSIKIRQLGKPASPKTKTPPEKTPVPILPASPVNPVAKPTGPVVNIAQPLGAPIEIGTPFPAPPPPPPKPVVIKKTFKLPPAPVPLPIPNPPDIPNVLVGMVLNSQGKILPNAIIEIRDASGMPIRASKTNKLGQFFIVTPLQTGNYEIETEYSGENFDIIKLKTEGKVIPPIKIQAKKKELVD